MLISYNWLQTYFKEKLPAPEALADLFTFHLCEVEGYKKVDDDTVFDLKVLPDRACYALCHWGIVYELSALLNLKPEYNMPKPAIESAGVAKVVVEISSELCNRYMARQINGVNVGNSSPEIVSRLEVLGQRSINSIVDAMNVVMFEIGQPLHAFDADLVDGPITIREAKDGETITTLDNKNVALKAGMLVIADNTGPLAIAGIKGGKRAGVTVKTKNIVIESANFDATSVRRTATQTGIRTDASKRFENNPSADVCPVVMGLVTNLVLQANPEAQVGAMTDLYPHKEEHAPIIISPAKIKEILGIECGEGEIRTLLERLVKVSEKGSELSLTIPFFRKDLRMPEDIVEEVGRLYGYDKVPSKLLPPSKIAEAINPAFYYEEKIKHLLVSCGFSEVFTPTLVEKGDIEIANPLAADKGALRTGLTEGLTKSLELNSYNAPILGLDTIKIFEIGTVFKKGKETISLGIAINDLKSKGKKNQTILDEAIKNIEEILGTKLPANTSKAKNSYEINLDDLTASLPKPTSYDSYPKIPTKQFVPFSAYPFIIRDIAVFVLDSVSEVEVKKVILEKAGPLVVRDGLFDVFKKTFPSGEVKVSYAFRLVFQSFDRTLADSEINPIMEGVTKALQEKGWEVR